MISDYWFFVIFYLIGFISGFWAMIIISYYSNERKSVRKHEQTQKVCPKCNSNKLIKIIDGNDNIRYVCAMCEKPFR
jgi:DNA-directed RNA polymerase subunit RPC12/RpoP